MHETQTVIIGAGPHGLAAAAHLGRAGVETTVFGDPMSFWRTMPKGMLLRSNWTATSIAEYDGPLSLDSYCTETGSDFHLPVPLDRFIDYGMWVQNRAAPHVDRRAVERVERDRDGFVLTLNDESRLAARRVVVAAGIADFVHRPAVTEGLPSELVSHTSEHDDLGVFREKTVLVVGGGQSALESAALMTESGADVEVAARADHLNWLHGGKYHRMLGKWSRLVYAPTDVGPMGLSRIVAVPDLFRRFPRALQEPMAYRAIRPAGAAWLRPRLEDVPIHVGTQVRSAEVVGDRLRVGLDDGSTRTVDHLLLGTGYRVDISRYPFLDPALAGAVQCVGGYPRLKVGMESSVSGLHFLGAPAAYSFGPIMRFVAGGWYGAESLTGAVTGRQARSRAGSPLPVSE
ncbi:NAD(P)-binding domain-containing protein [Nocardioides sp. WL0053]|uniref:NAD(P)-binding domain-containing protein n=1 Tax=Nocardioides jiangsuensis TaxID=2866161 RepID=A0ABS7RIK5_9ACTN|nr:FAD-dependent oxidoreductase [Nocardioides jiangsuensis]MBY9074841.1 NAD(P)-binding domain-containing protein [Nocardioides jiangsuensis]